MTAGTNLDKLGIFCFTTYKNLHLCRCIENTWGRKTGNLYFFTDCSFPVHEEGSRYIQVTRESDYASHVVKTYEAIQYAYKIRDSLEWFFFICDDHYLFLDNFSRFLEGKDCCQSIVYGQIANTWRRDRELFYPLGGAGVLFSRGAIESFVENAPLSLEQWKHFTSSDTAIGVVLRELKIKIEHAVGFYSQPPEFYKIKDPENELNFHYIKTPQQFEYLYDRERGIKRESPFGVPASRNLIVTFLERVIHFIEKRSHTSG